MLKSFMLKRRSWRYFYPNKMLFTTFI